MVKAYDVRARKKVTMKNVQPLKFKTSGSDVWRYRLAGESAEGNKLSRFVSKAEAEKYGTPKQVSVKHSAKKTTFRIAKTSKIKEDPRSCEDISRYTERRCRNIRGLSKPKKAAAPKKKTTPKRKAASKKKASK